MTSVSGYLMIDNLFQQVDKLETAAEATLESASLKRRYPRYGVLTPHRPSNVDNPDAVRNLIGALSKIAEQLPLIFPAHPRTQANLDKFGIALPESIVTIKPQAYMAFLDLFKDAQLVLTDSGGI